MALARLHRDSQPASQPRRLGRHSPGRTRNRARRPPRGRPAWSPRAPLPGDTHQLACHGERPARPTSAAATPPPCPAADEYTLITIHAHKAPLSQHHATPSPHLLLLPPALLPLQPRAAASPCALLPGDNIPHTPHARRLAPPPLPPPTPWIAPTLAHALPHAPRLSCLPLPPTATPLDPLTAADRNSIHCRVQQAVCAAAAGPLRRRASGSSWASLPAAACPTQMPFTGARRARPS